MLRLSKHSLRPFRQTRFRYGRPPPIPYFLHGKEWGSYDPEQAPRGSECTGLFCVPYTGLFTPLRFVDPFWQMNRFTALGKEGYFCTPFFLFLGWLIYYYVPMTAMYGDKLPPEEVDWNDEKTGYLPDRLQ